MTMRAAGVVGVAGVVLGMTAAAGAQVTWGEVEPNDSKAAATPVFGVGPGDLITGYSSGIGGGSGVHTPDYFRLRFTDPGPGLFRYRLVAEAGAAGLTMSVRGLRQEDLGAGVGGGVIAGSDVAVQNAIASLAPEGLTFDAAGPAEVYIRMQGSGLTTEGYRVRVSREAVAPIEWPRRLQPGAVTIGRGAGGVADVDFWVCDGAGQPIPGFGNDSPGRVTRMMARGEYLIAWSMANLAASTPSPGDDGWRRGALMDWGRAFCSFSETGASAPLAIEDGAGVETMPLTLGAREIVWVRVWVGEDVPDCAPCAADFDRSGGVDGEDIGAFFAAWQAGDDCGDVDGSGGVDGEDIGWFFARWQAGGC